MANFTITIGPVSTTNTVDTTKAMTIIGGYIAAYDGPVNGTNQQKVDWLLDHLQGHIRQVALGYNRRIAEAAAAVAAEQEERVRTCAASLAEVLDVYGCELVGVPGLTADGRIVAQVVVKVKP